MTTGLRKAFSHLARFLCERYVSANQLKPRLILDREGGSVYLERYYLLGGPSEDPGAELAPLTVCLHRFRRSDDDLELHNHPWKQSASFVLAGGYSEERRIDVKNWMSGGHVHAVKRFDVFPFSFNFIADDDFHRVDLYEDDAWTIFVTSAKTQSWGFWNRVTDTFTPWREFIAKKRGIDPSQVGTISKSEDIPTRPSSGTASGDGSSEVPVEGGESPTSSRDAGNPLADRATSSPVEKSASPRGTE